MDLFNRKKVARLEALIAEFRSQIENMRLAERREAERNRVIKEEKQKSLDELQAKILATIAENVQLRDRLDQFNVTAAIAERRSLAERAAELEGFRRPEQPLDNEEMSAALDVELDNDLWLAFQQLLDDAILVAFEMSTKEPSESFPAERRTFAAGGADFLRDFQKDLIRARAKARAKAAEVAEKKEE